jgi:hypothetical protein
MSSINNSIEHFDLVGSISSLGNPATMVAFGQSIGLIPSGSSVTVPPDNSILITKTMQQLILPYVKVHGHMTGNYTLDPQNLMCKGTITSLVNGEPAATQNISYLAVKNLPSYYIFSKNDPDEILIVTDDGQYIFPFYEGPSSGISAYDNSLIFATILALIVTMQNNKNSSIPLYSDLKILFWASVSLCNYSPYNVILSIATGKYQKQNNPIPSNLMPLARMAVLAADPTLDRSGILYTGDIRSYSPSKDNNEFYKPPQKDQNNNPIPYTDYAGGNYKIPSTAYASRANLLSRYTFLSKFLDNFYNIMTNTIDTSMSNITFAANYANIPVQFQPFDSRNPRFIIAPSVPRPPPQTPLTTVASPRYTGGPRQRFNPLPNDTYVPPPNPATYSPPDVNLLNGPLPVITKTGYINNYTLDNRGICNGTLNANTSASVSYIPIKNESRYKISALNNPDQILITTNDGKYILPFADGSITLLNSKYHTALLSYLIASSNNTMTIPLYNDLRILYYAANSQLNDFTSNISNNQIYSRFASNLQVLPLIKMLILSSNPSLDKSTILKTGDLSIQNYETDPSTGLLIPPTTDQSGQPIPSSLPIERSAVFYNLYHFLNAFRAVNTSQVNVSTTCLSFTASTIDILPTSLQTYDCRNSKFGNNSNNLLPDEASLDNAPDNGNAPIDYSEYYPLIGIGFGVVCCICIIGGIVIFFMMKSKKNKIKSDGGFYLYDVN